MPGKKKIDTPFDLAEQNPEIGLMTRAEVKEYKEIVDVDVDKAIEMLESHRLLTLHPCQAETGTGEGETEEAERLGISVCDEIMCCDEALQIFTDWDAICKFVSGIRERTKFSGDFEIITCDFQGTVTVADDHHLMLHVNNPLEAGTLFLAYNPEDHTILTGRIVDDDDSPV